MYLLPSDFDFHGSLLFGYFDIYLFESVIGKGAQGEVLKFHGINTGLDVVFKLYRAHFDSSSTRFPGDSNGAYYFSYLNEKDKLEYLSVISRVNVFVKNTNPDLFLSFYKDILRIHRNYAQYRILQERASVLFETASEYNHVEKLLGSNFSSWPLIVDYARFITNPSSPNYFPATSFNSNLLGSRILGNDDLNEFSIPIFSFVRGRPLSQIINSGDILRKRTDIIESLVRAVSNIHYFGIAHRDIKPENIIVHDDGSVVLVDFGISQRFAPSDRVFFEEQIRSAYYTPDKKEMNLRLNTNHKFTFEGPAEDWLGSRFFSNIFSETRKKTSPFFKDDVFSVVILIIILLTGQHPLMPNVPFEKLLHDKDLKRAYKAKWLDKYSPSVLSQELSNFKALHNSSLIKVLVGYLEKDMTDTEGKIRNLARTLGVKLSASFPKIFDDEEFIINNYRKYEHLTLNFSDYAHYFAIARSDLGIVNKLTGKSQFEKSSIRFEPTIAQFPVPTPVVIRE